MANHLSTEKKVAAISALAEGMSIRATERMIGVHRDTIMRLGLRVGQACTAFMDETMHDLNCRDVQIDEIWGFIGKKEGHMTPSDPRTFGDVYTFVAVDSESKLVPCFDVGKRDKYTTRNFIADLASRLTSRIQLSSDGLVAYVDAVERGFGPEIDYAQTVKQYATSELEDRKYSPPQVISCKTATIVGRPDPAHISTSYVESQNLTIRMHCRRLTRLTNAFSKKVENFKAAMGLHFTYYNFVKRHTTLRMTPAMAAGLANDFWEVSSLIGLTE